MSRDDFSKLVKEALAKRVGTLCSNPNCCVSTYGPNEKESLSTTIGVAAHITAAEFNGPRYDENLIKEDRCSIENGIWLCQNCARKIDVDYKRYPVQLLKSWKNNAEERAEKSLGEKLFVDPQFIKSNSIVVVCKQKKTKWPKGESVSGWSRAKVSLKPLRVKHELKNVYIPMIFNPILLKPNQNLWSILYQNLSDKVENNIILDINFKGAVFENIAVNNQSRVELIEGSLSRASFAKFLIREALPKEKRSFKVIAKKGITPDVSCFLDANKEVQEVHYFELVYE